MYCEEPELWHELHWVSTAMDRSHPSGSIRPPSALDARTGASSSVAGPRWASKPAGKARSTWELLRSPEMADLNNWSPLKPVRYEQHGPLRYQDNCCRKAAVHGKGYNRCNQGPGLSAWGNASAMA